MKEPGDLDTWLSRTTAAATLVWIVLAFTTDAVMRAPWWFTGFALALVVAWATVLRQDAQRWQAFWDAQHQRDDVTDEELVDEYLANLRNTVEEKDDD